VLGHDIIDGLDLIHLVCGVPEELRYLRIVSVEDLSVLERDSGLDDDTLSRHIVEIIEEELFLILVSFAPIEHLGFQLLHLHDVIHDEEREHLVELQVGSILREEGFTRLQEATLELPQEVLADGEDHLDLHLQLLVQFIHGVGSLIEDVPYSVLTVYDLNDLLCELLREFLHLLDGLDVVLAATRVRAILVLIRHGLTHLPYLVL
jgi:hypothetical protein